MSTVLVELPLFSELSYRYSASLETVSLQFKYYWNERATQWQMDIRLEDQTPVILGYALVPQYPMLIDLPLENIGLSGHFELLPVNVAVASALTQESSVMPEFFKLYYVYDVEDAA
ncbi:hypothetical protein V8U11_16045 [Pseudomonas chlororaphis]|uniref:phage baseplate plug family protein n=1 Tax=Pseudomonas chlororaphis TaxID=587753 RepID=UPI0030CD5202